MCRLSIDVGPALRLAGDKLRLHIDVGLALARLVLSLDCP